MTDFVAIRFNIRQCAMLLENDPASEITLADLGSGSICNHFTGHRSETNIHYPERPSMVTRQDGEGIRQKQKGGRSGRPDV